MAWPEERRRAEGEGAPGRKRLTFATGRGRVRAHGDVRIEPGGVDQSRVSIDLEIKPAALGHVLWWVAGRLKMFDDPELKSGLLPREIMELLGAPESEWAEVRADLPKVFSGTLASPVSEPTPTPSKTSQTATPARDGDPYPNDPDEPWLPFDERDLSA